MGVRLWIAVQLATLAANPPHSRLNPPDPQPGKINKLPNPPLHLSQLARQQTKQSFLNTLNLNINLAHPHPQFVLVLDQGVKFIFDVGYFL